MNLYYIKQSIHKENNPTVFRFTLSHHLSFKVPTKEVPWFELTHCSVPQTISPKKPFLLNRLFMSPLFPSAKNKKFKLSSPHLQFWYKHKLGILIRNTRSLSQYELWKRSFANTFSPKHWADTKDSVLECYNMWGCCSTHMIFLNHVVCVNPLHQNF